MKRVKLQKVTLNLREGDMDLIRSYLPSQKASVLIRKIISKYVDKIVAEDRKVAPLLFPELDEDETE